MTPVELKNRTMEFAVRTLKMVDALPKSVAGRTVANQIARSATSVAANYRAALRGRSRAEFLSKIGITLEEADETTFWLELTIQAGLLPKTRLQPLHTEAEELTKIFNATRSTTKGRSGKNQKS
ncbi:four helix bundle protein [Roseimicrobium sp. ORNL1]|uniref:four helix bundle protein n=1 Tax=Roseimicrobium sp. ORNL1 TaxID=2711231 RepID=UPI0013E12488|nr:four helix bundle protein [Roseimicrobium sp. ORNL1]QIF00965.1 four helix bundle protein [Roseimicrobium sp. ORNL1]